MSSVTDAAVSMKAILDEFGGLSQLEWLVTEWANTFIATVVRLGCTSAPHQVEVVSRKG